MVSVPLGNWDFHVVRSFYLFAVLAILITAPLGAIGMDLTYQTLLEKEDVEVVDICLPNYLHYEMCLKAAKAMKHVIVEKPLAVTLEQADEMIKVCKNLGRKLMYAEELCLHLNMNEFENW